MEMHAVPVLLLKKSVKLMDVIGQEEVEVEVVVILEEVFLLLHLKNALVATTMMELLLVEI